MVDTHDCRQTGQATIFHASAAGGNKMVKDSSGLLKRRRSSLELSTLKIPCVEKLASPLTILGDRYKILEKLGSGCAGMVHRAIPLESADAVALKMPREKDPAKAVIAEQEYHLLKRLSPHPNIIKVFDFHNLQGEATLVLEFFDGVSLQAAVKKDCMPEPIARSLCTALFNAVAHVHNLNILHRDIKPQNILVSHCLSDLRLIDFNVATCIDDGALTCTGTERYKAPELLRGENPCERSDVWASGLCAFFMLSGKLPQGRDAETFRGVRQDCAAGLDLFDGAFWQHVSEQCKQMCGVAWTVTASRGRRWRIFLTMRGFRIILSKG